MEQALDRWDDEGGRIAVAGHRSGGGDAKRSVRPRDSASGRDSQPSSLIRAMAVRCRATLEMWHGTLPDLPPPLRRNHLAWMCDMLIGHSEDWTLTRLHRWVGFIQCGLLANGMLDLNGAKAMFDEVKLEHGAPDDDLLDHLDPASSFELEIGGQG